MAFLIDTPAANDFLNTALLDSGLSATLGDPAAMDAEVRPAVLSARMELRSAAQKLAALVADATRSEPQKHDAGRQLAERVVGKLAVSRAALEARAEHLQKHALAAADIELGPRLERGALQSEIRSWIREQAKNPDGLQVIRAAVKENTDAAAILWHSPSFLLGLADSVLETFRFEALQAARPELYENITMAIELRKIAAKHASVARRVAPSFFNPSIAEKIARRVTI